MRSPHGTVSMCRLNRIVCDPSGCQETGGRVTMCTLLDLSLAPRYSRVPLRDARLARVLSVSNASND